MAFAQELMPGLEWEGVDEVRGLARGHGSPGVVVEIAKFRHAQGGVQLLLSLPGDGLSALVAAPWLLRRRAELLAMWRSEVAALVPQVRAGGKGVKLADLPPEYQEQARQQVEGPHAAPEPVELSSKADDKAERDLQTLCEQELSRLEIAFLHLSFRAREKKGWPDLTFALDGRPIAVELTAKGGTLSQDQVKMLTTMKKNRWEVYVLRAFQDFYDMLRGGSVKQWAKAGGNDS